MAAGRTVVGRNDAVRAEVWRLGLTSSGVEVLNGRNADHCQTPGEDNDPAEEEKTFGSHFFFSFSDSRYLRTPSFETMMVT